MKISVIVPVYNKKTLLPELIRSLLNQNFQGKYEIIIVDDGSTDGTEDVFKHKRQNLTYVKQKNKGPAAARNTGLKIACGNIVAFTDSDCIPDKRWLSELSKAFIEGVDGVEGRTITNGKICPDSHHIKNLSGGMYLTSNIAFLKSSIKSGFDEKFRYPNREDTEISYRLIKNGGKIVFNKNALVRHRLLKSSLLEMVKRKLYFESDVLLFKKNTRLYKKYIKFPFSLFMPGYFIFTIAGFFNNFIWFGLLLTTFIEIIYRKYCIRPASFVKFLLSETIGSFVNIYAVLNGCRKYRVNPLRLL